MIKTRQGDVVGTNGKKTRPGAGLNNLDLPGKALWTIDEWAALNNISRASVYNWARQGYITLVRVGPRATRVSTPPDQFAASRQSIYADRGEAA
jgi:hypothetical protein